MHNSKCSGTLNHCTSMCPCLYIHACTFIACMIPCLGFTFASPVPDSTLALIAHKVCLLLLTTRMPSIAERSCKAGSHKSVPPCPPWFGEHLGTSQIARVGHGRGWSRGRNPRALFLFILTPFGTSTQKPTQTSTDPPPPPQQQYGACRSICVRCTIVCVVLSQR